MALCHISFVPYLLYDDIFHGLLLSCSEDEGYDFSVVRHYQLVDEVDCLFVYVTGHNGVFQVLKAVVDVDALLNVVGRSGV
jgi:hypothetical protein